MKKIKNKNKKIIRNIAIAIGITLAVGLILMLIGNKMNSNAIKSQQEAENYQDWLSETCECLAKTRHVCTLNGFEYNATRNLCVNSAEKTVTTSSMRCSEYNCSGEIKLWNNITEIWEDKIN